MDGGNHDIMDHNQDLGDGEVINMEQSGVKYPFSFVRHGEDFRWWEYQIPENNNYLVSFYIKIFNIVIFIINYY
jgi:hypothetical protein